MKRITRYVLFELLSVFLVTLTGITLLLILAGVASEGMREGLGFGPLMRMVPYVVPVALQVSVPATILLATSSVFGRMSADNEIVAIKSLGISPLAVLIPAFALAFVVSLVAVWINDIAVSWGRTGIYRVVVESVEEVAYRMLKTQREYQTPAFSINVKDVIDRQLIQPTIRVNSRGGKKMRFDATTAQLKTDASGSKLKFMLTDLNLVEDDISLWFDHYELDIPLLEATRKGDSSGSPSLVPLHRVPAETRQQMVVAGKAERQGATLAAFQMMTGDFSQLAESTKWERRHWAIHGARARLNRLHLEPWRRWATGFSCFFFVLVGAPLAIRMKTANFFTTFAACFLPILIIYYPLLAMGVNQCKGGAVPPYTVWLGNLVLSAVGAWMIRGVVRY